MHCPGRGGHSMPPPPPFWSLLLSALLPTCPAMSMNTGWRGRS